MLGSSPSMMRRGDNLIIAGLDPAILFGSREMDARFKPEHDEKR
jgi:hypothetical protein